MNWHRSDLLFSDVFDELLNTFEFAKESTQSFLCLWPLKDLTSATVISYFNGFTKNTAEPDVWRFEEEPYQRGLFFFLVGLIESLRHQNIGSAVIICDRFDVFRNRIKKQALEDDGFARFQFKDPDGRIEGDYCVMIPFDKDREHVLQYRPWLNLIDGELWLIQRSQSTPLSDGNSIWQRAMSWRDQGRPQEYELLLDKDECFLENLLDLKNSEEDKKALANNRLKKYFEHWMQWCIDDYCQEIKIGGQGQ